MIWADFRLALAFLTTIPVKTPDTGRPPGYSFTYFTLIGTGIGLLLFGVGSLTLLPDFQVAFLVVLAWVVITGGLHLDGFGDACDGLFAATTPARRLEIMKDSRAGSWAVIGLVLLLLGKFLSVSSLTPALLILPPVAGRWVMVMAAWAFPYARQQGSGGYFRDGLGWQQAAWASVVASLILLAMSVFLDLHALLALPVVILVLFGVGQWASERLGVGLTGDLYGAMCELTELLVMLVLTIDLA